MAAPKLAPETIAPPVPREEREPVYVWDLVVRASHWVIAATIALLAATGIYIGHPFLSAAGQANEHFLMGWAKIIHFYAAIAFTLAVLSRIAWLFLGPRRSGWRNFVPVAARRRRDLWTQLKFYMLIGKHPARTIGHNPLAGLSYVGIFALYVLMILTGLAMYSVSADSYMRIWEFLVPLFNGLQWARWIHHAVMWLLIMFIVMHLFFAMITSRTEKTGTFDSIFSGYKYMPKGQPPDDE